MRALLVMDMQEAVLGKNRNKKFTYESDKLITSVNGEISKFDKENVYYIKTVNKENFVNKILSKKIFDSTPESQLVEKLNVVNKRFLNKNGNNVFDIKELENEFKKSKIDEIQIVGVDTCSSICQSAISGLKKGFKVILNKNLIASINDKKANNLIKKMQTKGAKILN